MSRHLKDKLLLNCGRKRKMTLGEAKGQKRARESAGQDVRVYKCEKCNSYHTTTKKQSSIDWNKI